MGKYDEYTDPLPWTYGDLYEHEESIERKAKASRTKEVLEIVEEMIKEAEDAYEDSYDKIDAGGIGWLSELKTRIQALDSEVRTDDN